MQRGMPFLYLYFTLGLARFPGEMTFSNSVHSLEAYVVRQGFNHIAPS